MFFFGLDPFYGSMTWICTSILIPMIFVSKLHTNALYYCSFPLENLKNVVFVQISAIRQPFSQSRLPKSSSNCQGLSSYAVIACVFRLDLWLNRKRFMPQLPKQSKDWVIICKYLSKYLLHIISWNFSSHHIYSP